MNEKNQCPRCGAEVPGDSPEGLCVRCLGRLNLEPETVVSGGERAATWAPPPLSALAPLFLQLELLDFVGRGGMGAVYKARQKELDRIVALKILPPGISSDPAFAERFAREARAMAKLNHPGIVTIHDFGRADGLFYFLMEFVDGLSLRQLMHAGRVSPREALAIVPQICDALQYAHDQGLVHRDIKPENILLDRRGRVKVADFGLAKLIEGESDVPGSQLSLSVPSTHLTEAGKVMGTPHYMAPEQVEHPAEVDHRADIYALGVVFYQMLTGELPGKPLEPPSKKIQVDVRLDKVVLRALEREPERRYQQASQVKTAMETITQALVPGVQQNKPTSDRKATSLSGRSKYHATKGHSRRIVVAALLSLGAVLALWMLSATLGQHHRPRENGQAASPVSHNASAEGEKPSTSAFGPVIERVLNELEDARGNQGLNLATGIASSSPCSPSLSPVENRRLFVTWFRTNDMNLLVHYSSNQWSMLVIGLMLSDFPAERWYTATLGNVKEALRVPTRLEHSPSNMEASRMTYLLPPDASLPITLAFASNEGAIGLLQITGFSQNPPGVRFRYKLARQNASTGNVQTNEETTISALATRSETTTKPPPASPTPYRPAKVAFGSVIERTLRSDGNECDFLVLRTGKVLRHSCINPGDERESTPPSVFRQWVLTNGVDLSFCSSTDAFYSPFGLLALGMASYRFPYATVPPERIPTFRSVAEWQAYNAHHDLPAENPMIGSLVGVTNIWNDLTADQLLGPPDGEPAFFLKEKRFALWYRLSTNQMPPIAFSTREGDEGLLQIIGFTESPPSVKLRYKLVQRALSRSETGAPNGQTESAAQAWLARVQQLKQYLEQNPQVGIRELKFVTENDWLAAAQEELKTDTDYRRAMNRLRVAGETSFVDSLLQPALRRYVEANNGQFPADLAQLQPFFPLPVDEAILQRYEIVPRDKVPAAYWAADWVVTQRAPVDKAYDRRLVVGAKGGWGRIRFE